MLGKKLRTEDDRIKAAAKARKKKRKKMIKTKYGQKAVRHSKRGVYSCTYAVVIAFLVIVMIQGIQRTRKDLYDLQGWNHSKCGIPCCYGCIICQGAYVDDRRKI